MDLSTPVGKLYKIGPAYTKKLYSLGIKTIENLLFYFPFRYDDFSDIIKIDELEINKIATVQGRVVDARNSVTYKKRMAITEIVIEDDSGAIKAVWFNQPFLKTTLRIGSVVNLSGKVSFSKEELIFSNPAYEVAHNKKGRVHTGCLVPVYHETYGLSSRWLRFHIKPLMSLANNVKEFLPAEILKSQNLLSRAKALKEIHFPTSLEMAKKAKRRFAFEELFLIQLWNFLQREKWRKNQSLIIPFNEKLVKDFVLALPFKLTDAQRKSVWQIFKDIEKPMPMNRLLEGDVGSGKTVVAIMAALEVINFGAQVALMAPTEILAEQHYKVFRKYLKDYKSVLLTGSKNLFNDSVKNRKEVLDFIKSGDVDIVIGTHALISVQKKYARGKQVLEFKNLALAIVDEQHRFGVEQRSRLVKMALSLNDGMPDKIPHLLSMTATPIPRTLALTIFGDLDISLLDEMPKGRKKVITKIISSDKRLNAYDFISREIKNGRQCFVICPLVEDSDVLGVKSVNTEYEKLQKIFPDFRIGLLHGRMKSGEKDEVMKDFKNKKINILVATSVVEVGIDVPNATVMTIEGSDRFGLAQLHQFRGRVGRGECQSYCFLFTDSTSKKAHQRLNALVKCQNGFELAEKDLGIRGPGEIYGTKQSGIPDLVMANLSDIKLISEARREAMSVFDKKCKLKECPDLWRELKKFAKNIHLE